MTTETRDRALERASFYSCRMQPGELRYLESMRAGVVEIMYRHAMNDVGDWFDDASSHYRSRITLIRWDIVDAQTRFDIAWQRIWNPQNREDTKCSRSTGAWFRKLVSASNLRIARHTKKTRLT